MSATLQTVTLTSSEHYGRKVPPKPFGELLRLIPDAVRQSIRMAFEGRSRAKGQRPDWLRAASDIRFVDHTGDDETILHFEAPRLGEAAQALYQQRALWPARPDPDDTGFDVLGDVVQEVAANNADSDRFDRSLLRQLQRFTHGITGFFHQLRFTGTRYTASQAAVITPAVIQAAKRLSDEIPQPQQTRIVGKLDMIRDNTNAFAIKLKHGQEVCGVLAEGEITALKGLFGKEVLVLGKTVYRPSGKPLRIDAYAVVQATDRDQFFSTIPKPKWSRYDLRRVLREQKHKQGLSAIFGKWPGDETDEQIRIALKDLE